MLNQCNKFLLTIASLVTSTSPKPGVWFGISKRSWKRDESVMEGEKTNGGLVFRPLGSNTPCRFLLMKPTYAPRIENMRR